MKAINNVDKSILRLIYKNLLLLDKLKDDIPVDQLDFLTPEFTEEDFIGFIETITLKEPQ